MGILDIHRKKKFRTTFYHYDFKYPVHTRYADYSGKVHSAYKGALKANQAVGLGKDEVRTFSNHVGIYIGKDCAGRDLWLHCTGGAIRTVAITSGNSFVHFYRMPGME